MTAVAGPVAGAATSVDPRADCQRIARELGTVVFPWDTTRALEMALLRTFVAALRTRAALLRVLPKRRRPRLRTRIARADYPDGYSIESLGPPPFS